MQKQKRISQFRKKYVQVRRSLAACECSKWVIHSMHSCLRMVFFVRSTCFRVKMVRMKNNLSCRCMP